MDIIGFVTLTAPDDFPTPPATFNLGAALSLEPPREGQEGPRYRLSFRGLNLLWDRERVDAQGDGGFDTVSVYLTLDPAALTFEPVPEDWVDGFGLNKMVWEPQT